MSDNEASAEVEAGGNNDGWTPPATQEDLNRIIADRVNREKAKYADYGDLKAKASQFDTAVESQKTEVQKALERAETAERELSTTRSEALRLSVLAKSGLPEELHEFVVGATEEELTAKAEKVKSLIPTNQEQQPAVRELFVPGEGRAPATALNGDGLEAALKSKLGIA